jgi:hypothetical protein
VRVLCKTLIPSYKPKNSSAVIVHVGSGLNYGDGRSHSLMSTLELARAATLAALLCILLVV